MKKFFTFILLCSTMLFSVDSFAQCECEGQEEIPVCVEDENGNVYTFPSECLANCFGLTVIDGDCEDIIIEEEEDLEWDDIFGEEWSDEWDQGWGFDEWTWTNFDWEEFDWDEEWFQEESNGEWDESYEDWLEECDCDENPLGEFVCAIDEFGFVFEFPSECHANCLGYDVVDCNWNEEEEQEEWGCDCDDTDLFEFVCVVDPSTGDIFEFPSACWAICEGLEIVDCDDFEEEEEEEEQEEESECDCDDEDFFDFVCVIDPSTGDVFDFPSACLALCEGLEIVDCDWNEEEEEEEEEEWECDCDENDPFDIVCVVDPATGDVFEFFSECWAICEGFEIVDCEWNEEEEEEEEEWECDCTDDDVFELVCVMDPITGEIFEFFSECLALCEGLIIVDCEWEEEETDEEENEEEIDCDCEDDEMNLACVMDPSTGEVFEFPSACLAECLGLVLVDCEWEEEMNEDYYWEDSDNLNFGLQEGDVLLKAYPNPSSTDLTIEWSNVEGEFVEVKILTITGQEVLNQTFNKSENPFGVNLTVQPYENGMYFIQVNGHSISFVKE